MVQIFEGVARSPRHASFYLSCGPADGTPVIFLHGWPELSHSWRDQLPMFGALGFRAIAPDMRGYGRSSVPADPSAYALEEIVGDVLELLDHLEVRAAVFVGHDWGAPVVWCLAQHHPERDAGMALRWTAAGMMEAAKGFRRLQGRKLLPALRAALAAHQAKHVTLERPAKAA